MELECKGRNHDGKSDWKSLSRRRRAGRSRTADLAEQTNFTGPTVIILGDVVSLAHDLRWFSPDCFGYRSVGQNPSDNARQVEIG